MTILEALPLLDLQDDANWTGDGLPQLAMLAKLMGRTPLRAEVTAAAPDFNRSNPVLPTGLEDDASNDASNKVDPVVEFEQAQDAIEEASKRRAEALKKLDELAAEKAESEPPHHVQTTLNIMDYVAKCNELRMERMRQHQEFRKMPGMSIEVLTGMAPIDAARIRNKARGLRPTVIPPMVRG